MRIDWYTKGILTAIAVLLGVTAIRPYVSPDAVAHAQGSFAGVQYSSNCNTCFFDSRTGEGWEYNAFGKLQDEWRLTKLGQPLVYEK